MSEIIDWFYGSAGETKQPSTTDIEPPTQEKKKKKKSKKVYAKLVANPVNIVEVMKKMEEETRPRKR